MSLKQLRMNLPGGTSPAFPARPPINLTSLLQKLGMSAPWNPDFDQTLAAAYAAASAHQGAYQNGYSTGYKKGQVDALSLLRRHRAAQAAVHQAAPLPRPMPIFVPVLHGHKPVILFDLFGTLVSTGPDGTSARPGVERLHELRVRHAAAESSQSHC